MIRLQIDAYLSDDAKAIREVVFMKEQGFQNEFDTTDEIAAHMVLYEDDAPIATCRLFWDERFHAYVLGRLAVLQAYRARSLGLLMVREAQRYVRRKGGKQMFLHAQCRAATFYQKAGFQPFGEIEDDEGCPHIWMKKAIA